MSERINSFKDLRAYQEACALDLLIFDETKGWPKEERYALIDQVRRSSRSIGANLAESWAKRKYPAHFLSKLTDADGELQETLHWLETASACDYLPGETFESLNKHAQKIGGMLGSMIHQHESFCTSQ